MKNMMSYKAAHMSAAKKEWYIWQFNQIQKSLDDYGKSTIEACLIFITLSLFIKMTGNF